MRWRIYYENGDTVSSKDCSPYDVFPSGAVAIAQEDSSASCGYRIWFGRDHFYWKPGMGWTPCDRDGLEDYYRMYQGPKVGLYGRLMRDDLYFAMRQRAEREGLGDDS